MIRISIRIGICMVPKDVSATTERTVNKPICTIGKLLPNYNSPIFPKGLSTPKIHVKTQNVNIYSVFHGADKPFRTIQMPILMLMRITSSSGVFTLVFSGTGTGTGTDMQKPFTLAVSGARTGHLKVIEILLKHTT